jgi:thiol:disulfide interchange protein DsbD
MNKIIVTLIWVVTYSVSIGQFVNPVSWNFELNKIDDEFIKISCIAALDKDWVIYSSKNGEDGPIPTSIHIEKGGVAVESIIEPLPVKKEFDELFDMELLKFKTKAVFIQKIKITGEAKNVMGFIQFMTCNGERCLPPTKVPFSFALNP